MGDEFLRACAAGRVDEIRDHLRRDADLVHARTPQGASGLHLAASHPDAVRLLLDAGADPQATGDLHAGGVIGWAIRPGNETVIALLLERGARHHIFSAMALRDQELVRRVVEENRATVQWYEALGFTAADQYEHDGELMFARLTLGGGELTLSPGDSASPRGVSLWFFTAQVQELYDVVRARALRAALANSGPDVPFEEDLYSPFYGGRQFSVRDPNGLVLVFYRPEDGAS